MCTHFIHSSLNRRLCCHHARTHNFTSLFITPFWHIDKTISNKKHKFLFVVFVSCSFSLALCQNCTFVCFVDTNDGFGFYEDIRSECTLALCKPNAVCMQNFFLNSVCCTVCNCVSTSAIIYLICNHCHIRCIHFTIHIIHFMHMHISYIDFQYIPFGQMLSACLPACMHACTNIKRKQLISRDLFSVSTLALPHIDFSHSVHMESRFHFITFRIRILDFSCFYYRLCVCVSFSLSLHLVAVLKFSIQ